MSAAFTTEVVLENTVVTEENAQNVWDEVTAERTGKPGKPAAKPADAPAVVTPEPAANTEVPPVDYVAKLAEIESKFETRLHKAESNLGRLTSAQGEIKAMVEAGKSVASQGHDAPTQTELNKAAANPAEWDALKADYPEWATATEKLLESRIPAFDAKAFNAEIKEMMKGQTDAVRKEIVDASLDAVFPGWKAEVTTPGFKTWAESQTEEIRALFASDNVGDAARALRLYEAAKVSNPATAIQEQRLKTLAAASATPKGVRTPNSTKTWEEMSAQERWDYEKRTRAKRRQ